MSMRNSLVVLCFLAFVAYPAIAATTTVELLPPFPTSADSVSLRVINPYIVNDYDLAQQGRHFVIDVGNCGFTTCVTYGSPVVRLGQLSPGTYTYEIFLDREPVGNELPVVTGSFVVANAGIPDAPTLSPAALIALCLILVAAGSFLIGRQS